MKTITHAVYKSVLCIICQVTAEILSCISIYRVSKTQFYIVSYHIWTQFSFLLLKNDAGQLKQVRASSGKSSYSESKEHRRNTCIFFLIIFCWNSIQLCKVQSELLRKKKQHGVQAVPIKHKPTLQPFGYILCVPVAGRVTGLNYID